MSIHHYQRWTVCLLTMADCLSLVELNQFEDPGWMWDQTCLLSLTEDTRLQVWIAGFIQNYRRGEERRRLAATQHSDLYDF